MGYIRQKPAKTNSRVFAQFMSEDTQSDNLSRKKAVEESVKMGGYAVSSLATKPINRETQQPMAGYSEFWLG